MKKLLILCLSLMIAASLVACKKTVVPELPKLETRVEAIVENEVAFEQAQKDGWIDADMILWIKDNVDKIGDKKIPTKLAVKDEYDYAYMGISFVLGDELQNMIKNGEVWMHNVSDMKSETEFNYSAINFNLVDKANPIPEFTSQEQYQQWLKTTKPFGSFAVVNNEYLKTKNIAEITQCQENMELVPMSDARYTLYGGRDSAVAAAELLAQTALIPMDMVPIPDKKTNPFFTMTSLAYVAPGALGNFKAETIDGKPLTNAVFKDYDLTMINLWTTTCVYCIEEMPILEELRTEMQGKGIKFNIIGMCLDTKKDGASDPDKMAKVREILAKTGATYDTVIPDDVLMNGRLKGVNVFPETFFVDKDGQFVGKVVKGARDKAGWQKTIDKNFELLQK